MTDQLLLERIVLEPAVMTGKPVIRGTRLTVEFVVNLLAHGATATEILDEYQGLTEEDIQACLLFASKTLGDSEFMPLTAESDTPTSYTSASPWSAKPGYASPVSSV